MLLPFFQSSLAFVIFFFLLEFLLFFPKNRLKICSFIILFSICIYEYLKNYFCIKKNTMAKAPISPKKPHNQLSTSSFCFFSLKLSIFLIIPLCVTLFTLAQIQSLHYPPSSWSFMHKSAAETRLKQAVTFLPIKDLRYKNKPLEGHTWFMSSTFDTQDHEGEVQYQRFPSKSSQGRVLCLKGNNTHDGSWNSYALAWPETLPFNTTLLKGLTFVSYNHYNYENIWHGLSSILPFVAWHARNQCELPNRWVLYHWGELRFKMGPWLNNLTMATFGAPPNYIEGSKWDKNEPICFEKAIVMRHNEGGMSRNRRIETYDLMRCKARVYCNVSLESGIRVNEDGLPVIGMTLFMRSGARSFKNESFVIEIFAKQCAKVDGCKLKVAYSNNLTFCEQVKLMSMTDILISPHGAQLTNMFLMDKNSSVMEFFPKGWLKLAGVGQFVYHWMASWCGMKHQGAWRDPDGDHCPYRDDDPRCMPIFKGGKIGFNETYFSEWGRNVLDEVRLRKMGMLNKSKLSGLNSSACGC
ncbi:uncharacterized protein LOC126660762 [Mercurialis annua]|uniref:uncharacterized protein LOC126660762 n=1 Tax=Mercurialis annua TaxID=3986 RepID=UPI00215E757A|nr:uncharacterized protein LOC126660762 [Mercurialis annua]